MQKDPIVITSIARTPIGCLLGNFKTLSATQLGANAIKAAVERSHLNNVQINEVIMGCVLTAGQGQAPARQAAISAGLPVATSCTTINKMCGSGMQAIIFAHDILSASEGKIMLAGGMESMTNAPYLLNKARQGYRMGNAIMLDHMMHDGLEDAYEHRLMGAFAEDCAAHYHFSRQAQDEFAINSLKRAQTTIQNGDFKNEIVPVNVITKEGNLIIDTDEQPGIAKIAKIPQLKPAFSPNGTVTAANSSSIADGAAALVLMRQSTAEKLHLSPLAKIVGHAAHAQEPAWFTTAPIYAVQKLLQKINWASDQVDLFEINEAFTVVTMAAMQELKLPNEKVNIHGGACALGHPIGASGARIVVTLIAALQQHKLKRGIASLCIGGGEATALAIELI